MAATSGSITDLTTMGASGCLRGALEFAWYRDAPAAGASHVLLALVACGDPASWPALAEAGITYRAMCGVLGEGEAPASDGTPVSDDGVAGEILADIAREVGPPGLIARLLRTSPSAPRRPAPPWTRGVRAVVGDALRSAQAAGRSDVRRADLLLALVSREDCAAAEILALLGVEREALRRRLEELHRPDGPSPVLRDLGRRPSGWVLGFLLRSGICSLPGRPDSVEWSVGVTRMIMQRYEELRAEFSPSFPAEERMLLAYTAAYADLAEDAEQFGPGWEACFPTGDVLARRGVTYSRVRALIRDPGPGDEPVDPLTFGQLLRWSFGSPLTREGVAEATRLLGHPPPAPPRFARAGHRGFALEIGLLGAMREPAVVRLLAELDADVDELRKTLVRVMR